MAVELLKFTPKTEKVSIFVSRFCLSIRRKSLSFVLLDINVMVQVLIIISICTHLHIQTCMIAKDTSVRNMKYVQYFGHIQYLHDSALRVKGRRLVHNVTDHYHRLMSLLVWYCLTFYHWGCIFGWCCYLCCVDTPYQTRGYISCAYSPLPCDRCDWLYTLFKYFFILQSFYHLYLFGIYTYILHAERVIYSRVNSFSTLNLNFMIPST